MGCWHLIAPYGTAITASHNVTSTSYGTYMLLSLGSLQIAPFGMHPTGCHSMGCYLMGQCNAGLSQLGPEHAERCTLHWKDYWSWRGHSSAMVKAELVRASPPAVLVHVCMCGGGCVGRGGGEGTPAIKWDWRGVYTCPDPFRIRPISLRPFYTFTHWEEKDRRRMQTGFLTDAWRMQCKQFLFFFGNHYFHWRGNGSDRTGVNAPLTGRDWYLLLTRTQQSTTLVPTDTPEHVWSHLTYSYRTFQKR